MPKDEVRELDVAGIGFGPAGISLACAVSDWVEANGHSPVGPTLFLEKASSTAWHGDFLLRDTDINHHVLRDLVTPRNPRSRFSFAMYLKAKGRLYPFGLLGRPPSRAEWSDYIGWVGEQLSDYVSYDDQVFAVAPEVEDDELTGFRISAAKGMYRARRIVLSSGSYPIVPEPFCNHQGRHVFHTSSYLTHIRDFGDDLPRRWLVVGSGQSAGEVVGDLLTRRPDIEIHSLHRSVGFRLGQLGQFPNRAFFPELVDYFHGLNATDRRQFLAEVRATNYAGIDVDQSQALYSLMYEDEIEGRERVVMHTFTSVDAIHPTERDYTVSLKDVFTGEPSQLSVDGIVVATGYEQPLIPPLLAELLPWLRLDEEGGVDVGRDYRVALDARPGVEVFANGLSERAHGISDGQSFSLVAVRAGHILSSLAATDKSIEQSTGRSGAQVL